MWILVKNNLYSIRKILIITNLIAATMGIVLSFIWEASTMMVPMYFFLSSIISISMTNKQISNNKKYNMFINNFGIKRKEVVQASMVLLLLLGFLSMILSTIFILIMNSINISTELDKHLSTIIVIIGFLYFYITLLSEGINYFNFKYGDSPKKNYGVNIMILLSVAVPQLFRLLDKIEIFNPYYIKKLNIENSIIISLALSILGVIGTFVINKVSQKNYEKREF